MAIYFPNSELGEVCGESWRITSSFTGDNNLIGGNSMTNWEKSDDVYGGGNLSTPILSHSNGQFTFSVLGYYLVIWQHKAYYNDNNHYAEMSLMVSWNSGSNWDPHGYALSSVSPNTSDNSYHTATGSSFVAATANARLRFNMAVQDNSVTTNGTTDAQATGFTLIKVSEI